ncbi:Non-ribosomal peptide synthetase OS=Lysinibacillus sphaericus OX=1421 GN=LS41612_16925 PE=3 SV=1 [Lysinibacillus sphaericus]
MESSTFHVCSNNGKRKRNLVLILPGVQDVNILWRKSGTVEGLYPLLKGYERTVEQLLKMLPQQTAEKVRNIENDDNEVKCYRALLGGYACVQMLRELGVQPSALVGEGIAELVSMVCAGAVTLRDAISIIQTYGQLATYEAIYEKYDLRKKQIPLIKKPGIKAKQHIEDALVIKLGSSDLENSITKRCMTNVEAENVLNLIENSSDSFINNVYRLIGDYGVEG